MSRTRVALIGANGHGLSHRRNLDRLAAAGVLEPVALCDRAPVPEPGAVPVFTDHRTMLASAEPDVVVICTPPPTHLRIALDAVAAGADLLLEKPPVSSLAEHAELLARLRRTGRACQVGFQALGSAALPDLIAAARPPAAQTSTARPAGVLSGAPSATECVNKGPFLASAVGAWWRPDAYWSRSPWAGRRRLHGRFVADGALANPFAHAVMQSLAVAAEATGWPRGPVTGELEWYRTRDIEVEDTACLRLTDGAGAAVEVAVTLASDTFVAGEVHAGGAALEYPTDRLRLPGDAGWRPPAGRVDLLENLLAHRTGGVPLVAPLERTWGFTVVLAMIAAAPPPTPVPDRYLRPHPDGAGRVIDGVADLLRAAADAGALPSELDVPWAVPPHRTALDFRPKEASDAQSDPR
ncbi:Gfo/Idh/MocA family oxidoreductase [Micromonospora sp. PLK6-60]|uniref:Gfo/Idh/MocA family protein n=1 Tax=Micromonospora sp. PLK6-60 TaxID=2873383 RepID=UPI001CA64A36|nr:Gfo/Idh/MocA family oxidoreductase [Micromonospora sp. PLK6-60]MBY8873753.1 Gfo/Idh/MocA family oxidoreductase [Micromonospora sp. PLK6-60]